jgi:hypothetical protein
VILIILLMLMGYALIFIPKSTAVSLWSPVNPEVFLNPRLVPPVWTNLFRKSPLPITISMDSNDQNVEKQILSDPDVVSLDRYTFRFDYSNANFPQDLSLRFNAQFQTLASLVTLTWIAPDGRTYDLGKLIANNDKLFIVSQDLSVKLTHLYNLDTRINALGKEAFTPVDALFASSNTQKVETARGTYQLIVNVQNFEPDASVHVTMVLYGKVYGFGGYGFKPPGYPGSPVVGHPGCFGIWCYRCHTDCFVLLVDCCAWNLEGGMDRWFDPAHLGDQPGHLGGSGGFCHFQRLRQFFENLPGCSSPGKGCSLHRSCPGIWRR